MSIYERDFKSIPFFFFQMKLNNILLHIAAIFSVHRSLFWLIVTNVQSLRNITCHINLITLQTALPCQSILYKSKLVLTCYRRQPRHTRESRFPLKKRKKNYYAYFVTCWNIILENELFGLFEHGTYLFAIPELDRTFDDWI